MGISYSPARVGVDPPATGAGLTARSFSLEEAQVHIESLTVRVLELERITSDHAQRFDTLQTPLWKRIWFRIDGWPGQQDLNAERRAWRPWRRGGS